MLSLPDAAGIEKFGTLVQARGYAASPELATAMRDGGVIGEPELRYLRRSTN